MSDIQWLHMPGYKAESVNPVAGCSPVSAGCAHCYAARTAEWLQRMGGEKYAGTTHGGKWTGAVRLIGREIERPLHWRKPRMIFWCSMSDLFHEEVPFWFVDKVMATVVNTPQHLHIWLTKRAARMRDYFDEGERSLKAPDNLWIGVTVENQDTLDTRLRFLLETPHVAPRFLSCEPLLGEINIIPRYLMYSLDWVICGGESGGNARPMDLDWARSLRDQCLAARVPFFFKQHGGQTKTDGAWGGQKLDGGVWHQFPVYQPHIYNRLGEA